MAVICPPDSAEHQICYCDTTIKKNKNKEVFIAAHGYRLNQLKNTSVSPNAENAKGKPSRPKYKRWISQ